MADPKSISDIKKLAFEKFNEGMDTHYKIVAMAALLESFGQTTKQMGVGEDVFIGIGQILQEQAVAIKSLAQVLEDISFDIS